MVLHNRCGTARLVMFEHLSMAHRFWRLLSAGAPRAGLNGVAAALAPHADPKPPCRA
ncbi:hypothetical protein [Acidocella aminolytica]|uniref:hypothetical protein n=1 Tax=Acidocella aminolytica TaxID=33998 RepID=UPI00223084BD|nr:hypothetical protein [Acidocella aminolytica]